MSLTVEQFNALERGDQIEGPPLFARLTDEPVVMLTVLKSDEHAEFVMSYMGVSMGRCSCDLIQGELLWQK